MFILRDVDPKLRKHPSLSQRGKVMMAGEIVVHAGRIKFIGNKNGHYQPSDDRLRSFLKYLSPMGVDLSETED